jgi:uncharacterized protein HemY
MQIIIIVIIIIIIIIVIINITAVLQRLYPYFVHRYRNFRGRNYKKQQKSQ